MVDILSTAACTGMLQETHTRQSNSLSACRARLPDVDLHVECHTSSLD